MRLYLASGSPRRAELLAQLGVPFSVLSSPGIDETPLTAEAPLAYVKRMAEQKAQAGERYRVAQAMPDAPLLAADTSIVLAGNILGKPESAEHAASMLAALNGRSHDVMTAVTVCSQGCFHSVTSVTRVHFRHMPAAELERYIATGEGKDKAGGYAIQGMGAALVASMQGSYSGVVGLPLAETAALLEQIHVPYWQPA